VVRPGRLQQPGVCDEQFKLDNIHDGFQYVPGRFGKPLRAREHKARQHDPWDLRLLPPSSVRNTHVRAICFNRGAHSYSVPNHDQEPLAVWLPVGQGMGSERGQVHHPAIACSATLPSYCTCSGRRPSLHAAIGSPWLVPVLQFDTQYQHRRHLESRMAASTMTLKLDKPPQMSICSSPSSSPVPQNHTHAGRSRLSPTCKTFESWLCLLFGTKSWLVTLRFIPISAALRDQQHASVYLRVAISRRN
jgi:hypothetical protein